MEKLSPLILQYERRSCLLVSEEILVSLRSRQAVI